MPGGIPASLRVTRRYYQPDSNNIIQEYENAKTFGDGAAQEWRNGLETLGKEAMADAARWEKWESQMQLGSDLSQVLREYDLSSFPKYTAEVQSRSAGASVTQLVAVTNGKHGSEHKGFIAVLFSICSFEQQVSYPTSSNNPTARWTTHPANSLQNTA